MATRTFLRLLARRLRGTWLQYDSGTTADGSTVFFFDCDAVFVVLASIFMEHLFFVVRVVAFLLMGRHPRTLVLTASLCFESLDSFWVPT